MNGFIDRAALSYIMAATELFSHPGEIPIQRMGFNCAAMISSWTVGARKMGDHYENAPQIIILTIMPSQSPITTVLSSLNATSYLNVYEYELHTWQFVSQQQYIAINSTQIYYQRCGLMNSQSGRCIDRPLVVVDAGEFHYHLYVPAIIIVPSMLQIAETDVSSVLVGSLVWMN